MALFISEVYEDGDKGGIYGESGVYETGFDSPGDLFRSCRREWGRCAGSVYIDLTDGTTRRIGWVFEKRVNYEDSGRYGRPPKTYLRRVWVTVHERSPEVTRTVSHVALGGK